MFYMISHVNFYHHNNYLYKIRFCDQKRLEPGSKKPLLTKVIRCFTAFTRYYEPHKRQLVLVAESVGLEPTRPFQVHCFPGNSDSHYRNSPLFYVANNRLELSTFRWDDFRGRFVPRTPTRLYIWEDLKTLFGFHMRNVSKSLSSSLCFSGITVAI